MQVRYYRYGQPVTVICTLEEFCVEIVLGWAYIYSQIENHNFRSNKIALKKGRTGEGVLDN